MRSFAINEPGSSVRALYATLVGGVTDLGLLTKQILWPSLKGKAFSFAEKKIYVVSYTL